LRGLRLGNSKEKSKASRPFNAMSLDLNLGNQDRPALVASPLQTSPLFAFITFAGSILERN